MSEAQNEAVLSVSTRDKKVTVSLSKDGLVSVTSTEPPTQEQFTEILQMVLPPLASLSGVQQALQMAIMADITGKIHLVTASQENAPIGMQVKAGLVNVSEQAKQILQRAMKA